MLFFSFSRIPLCTPSLSFFFSFLFRTRSDKDHERRRLDDGYYMLDGG